MVDARRREAMEIAAPLRTPCLYHRTCACTLYIMEEAANLVVAYLPLVAFLLVTEDRDANSVTPRVTRVKTMFMVNHRVFLMTKSRDSVRRMQESSIPTQIVR